MHAGNAMRKKILFFESNIAKKGASGAVRDIEACKSNYESLFNAQSYN